MTRRRKGLRFHLATRGNLITAADVTVIQLAVAFNHHSVADNTVLDRTAVENIIINGEINRVSNGSHQKTKYNTLNGILTFLQW